MQGICEYCQTRPCFIFNRFCGKKCAALAVNAGLCIFCHKRENTAGHKFCSKACADSAQLIGGAIHKKKLSQLQPVKRSTRANNIPDNTLLSRTMLSLSLPNLNGKRGKTSTDVLNSSREQQATDLRHKICSLPGCTRSVTEDVEGHYCSPKHEREASPQLFNETENRNSENGSMVNSYISQWRHKKGTESEGGVTYLSYPQHGSDM